MATFVLLHGGWHGGWCWRYVAERLRRHGHDVFTPTFTGLGERVHLASRDVSWDTALADVVGVIDAEELTDVTLVSHSLGAVAASLLLEQRPECIASVIWLDGLLLRDGESLRSFFTEEQEEMYQAAVAAGARSFPPPPPESFGVVEADALAWLSRRLTPHPFGFAVSPVHLRSEPGMGFRCTYIACTSPVHPFVAKSHRYAQGRPDLSWHSIETGHDAMITEPALVASLLSDLA